MLNKEKIRISIPGGIASPGELLKIVSIAQKVGTPALQFGLRQDVVMLFDYLYLDKLEDLFNEANLQFEVIKEPSSTNIVSSFAAAGVFENTSWLRTGHYYEIIDEFKSKPSLKINIVDPMQGLVPLLTGHLNFVASEKKDFWYLFIKFPESKSHELWPCYIATEDVQRIAMLICEQYSENDVKSLKTLKGMVDNHFGNTMPIVKKRPEYPLVPLPNYDGIHSTGDQYWLGIYKRNHKFPVEFIQELAMLCNQTKLGKIAITPWHSLIVKNIEKEHLVMWEMLLNKYDISTQHSSLELNWQVPTLDEEAIKLKYFIYSEFDKMDLRTNGLTFGLRTKDITSATNVIIEKVGNFLLRRYKVSYSKEFNPNNKEYIVYTDQVRKRDLPEALFDLTKKYRENIEKQSISIFDYELHQSDEIEETSTELENKVVLYQCKHCLSEYDSRYGDVVAGIGPNTSFKNLPDDYVCSTCESPKEDFKEVVVIQSLEEVSV